MKKVLKRATLVLVLVAAGFIVSVIMYKKGGGPQQANSHNVRPAPQELAQKMNGSLVPITIDDVKQAGFSVIDQEFIRNNTQPAEYFRISGVPPGAKNIVFIAQADSLETQAKYRQGSDIKPFDVSGGTGQEGIHHDGRTVIHFSKNGTYMVVMGWGRKKTEALAFIIANKIK